MVVWSCFDHCMSALRPVDGYFAVWMVWATIFVYHSCDGILDDV